MRGFALALAVCLVSVAAARAAGPSEILIRPGAAQIPPGAAHLDHSAWSTLLQRYVDGEGLVNYSAWKREGQGALAAYLEQMAAVAPGMLGSESERIAYWINVYNALTVHGMLAFYPTKSIKDHVSLVFGFHFWKDTKIEVEGVVRSLDAIEHKILRKMGEPRIHFAIVCASLGCPRLRNHAYAGEGLGAQLDDNARHFFSKPRNYRLDRAKNTLYLSSIFDWFGNDFGSGEQALRDVAAGYVSEEDRRYLLRRKPAIEFLHYDWRINEQK